MVNRNNIQTPNMNQDKKLVDNQALTKQHYERNDIRRRFDDDIEIAQEFTPLFHIGDSTGLFAGLKTRALVEEGERKLLEDYHKKRK